jgi:hypothetical protein
LTAKAKVVDGEQSPQEWPTWRPGRVSRLVARWVFAPMFAAFSVAVVIAVYAGSAGQVASIFGMAMGLVSFVGALEMLSVSSVLARIEDDRLVLCNRFWSSRVVPLASITAVRSGTYGLIVTCGEGEAVSVDAIVDPFGTSRRAAGIAAQIQAAAARLRAEA